MKRSLLIIPLLLLIVLNACGKNIVPPMTDVQWTAIVQTQEAMRSTREQRLESVLNAKPADQLADLELRLVGNYPVTHVTFPQDHFQVEVRCECAPGSACCNPDQMFMVTLRKIALYRDQVLVEIPPTVQWLAVVCTDSQLQPLATLYASWSKVRDFLTGHLSSAEMNTEIIRQQD